MEDKTTIRINNKGTKEKINPNEHAAALSQRLFVIKFAQVM